MTIAWTEQSVVPDLHEPLGVGEDAQPAEVVESPARIRVSAARRVWIALCDIRHFIGHELPAAVTRGDVIDVAHWEPIHRGWRILQDEQAGLPAAVFAEAQAVFANALQPGLNRFLDTLGAAIAARRESDYDAQKWIAQVNQQLGRVQEQFADRLGILAELLPQDGR
ncbi:MAG TPA: hypothetical protein VKN18_12830 [Blastocatellia bacterium]|nr:hypothetical protein [Blastocatellia bacterium]